ncbi:replication-relaxation family protein [Ectobacillus sp. SYSU M60031]|uniref:Replication-relaxation family protein n=1 Tax=Ectobacillus ponti TaxID=2961894 RepID=A0AA42BUJ4_9BACI|nr:replication-relaxation family protein [Ectobacillus ponti]MCP8970588.1 replication-relaxation family protein [Ectobacillus ponti]
MKILILIKQLHFATRRHLMAVLDLGGIRNANRILKELQPYLNIHTYRKEHVYSLNKAGRLLFGEEGKSFTAHMVAHAMLRNEAWLMMGCPDDWQIETMIRYKIEDKKKTILPDVKLLDDQGILCAVEIDRAQKMKANEVKLQKYAELTKYYRERYNGRKPIIYFFTITSYRCMKLEQLAAKYDAHVIVQQIMEV